MKKMVVAAMTLLLSVFGLVAFTAPAQAATVVACQDAMYQDTVDRGDFRYVARVVGKACKMSNGDTRNKALRVVGLIQHRVSESKNCDWDLNFVEFNFGPVGGVDADKFRVYCSNAGTASASRDISNSNFTWAPKTVNWTWWADDVGLNTTLHNESFTWGK